MELKTVTQKLVSAFESHGCRYALTGGVALGLWGYARATVDLDFLLNYEDSDKADAIMRQFSYECRFRSKNIAQYIAVLKIFGEVDFLYAFRRHSLGMLSRAEEKTVFDTKIKVLRPEDIIGLKLQAIHNSPERKSKDWPDIETLVLMNRNNLDWKLIEEYFSIFGMAELYKTIAEHK
ncbi:MAG: nucleotidyl transferase AbiEii/AbiGii toxin family protein [Planctomycetes bacterium]|nr:nucleotidyl transferase AbiEii/AbiGii toxin family protein [Planctomycetota bacterium]